MVRRRASGLVLICVALAGCGSTVQMSSQTAQGGDVQLGTGTTPAGGAVAGSAAAAGIGSTSHAVGGSGAAGSGSASAPGSVSVSGPVSSAPSTVGGSAAKKPVEVGIVIFPDVNQFAAALGSSANTGDQQAQARAAVDWANKHGGLGGHPIKPVFFSVSLTSTQPYSVTYQQICDSFTKDHHVVATVLVANVDNTMPQCLAKGGSMTIINGHFVRAAEDYAATPSMVAPSEAGGDRIARALVREILGHKLVKSGDTLGLLVMDYNGPNKARDKIIVPGMKEAGVGVVSYSIHAPQSTPDIANSVQQVQSAELQMRAQGVKTVTFVCPGCANFFIQYAESQAYYPQYVFTSLDGLKKNFGGQGHGKSIANALAVGWDPIRDVGAYTNPQVLKDNASFAQCAAIEKGQYGNDDAVYASQALCGEILDLHAAAAANAAAVTGPGIVAGMLSLGSTHPSSFNFGTLLAQGHSDGTSAYRTLHYVSACDCLQYDGGPLASLS